MHFCIVALCIIPLYVMAICVMSLPYGYFRDGSLQNWLVAIQIWIEAFRISITLFQY